MALVYEALFAKLLALVHIILQERYGTIIRGVRNMSLHPGRPSLHLHYIEAVSNIPLKCD